jgi:glycosyltransferase involved in cell wall biosynthesis
MTSPRVALDLAGSFEALGESTAELGGALERLGTSVEYFATRRVATAHECSSVRAALWRPLWSRHRGPAIDRWLPTATIIHVAGDIVPPVRHAHLVVSVDDLRPLRDRQRDSRRAAQLRRAAESGATVVASSHAAGHEIAQHLSLRPDHLFVVAPPVSWTDRVHDGVDLVVNLTGSATPFRTWHAGLSALANSYGGRLVVVASREAAAELRASAPAHYVPRSAAASALRRARLVLHVSDGARFPSFIFAAMAAGVPTCATATEVNRELLAGVSYLADSREPDFFEGVRLLWHDEARRAIARSAGIVRARDVAPDAVAHQYREMYERITSW